jgi:hypothetical protein
MVQALKKGSDMFFDFDASLDKYHLDGRRETEDGRRKTEDGRRETGEGRRETEDGRLEDGSLDGRRKKSFRRRKKDGNSWELENLLTPTSNPNIKNKQKTICWEMYYLSPTSTAKRAKPL